MKKPISATIDKDLIDWIEREVNDTRKYRNKSHLIEVAIELLKSRKSEISDDDQKSKRILTKEGKK